MITPEKLQLVSHKKSPGYTVPSGADLEPPDILTPVKACPIKNFNGTMRIPAIQDAGTRHPWTHFVLTQSRLMRHPFPGQQCPKRARHASRVLAGFTGTFCIYSPRFREIVDRPIRRLILVRLLQRDPVSPTTNSVKHPPHKRLLSNNSARDFPLTLCA